MLFVRNTEPCLQTERKETFGREGRNKKEDIVRGIGLRVHSFIAVGLEEDGPRLQGKWWDACGIEKFVGRGGGILKTLMISVFLMMLKSVHNGITGLAKKKKKH